MKNGVWFVGLIGLLSCAASAADERLVAVSSSAAYYDENVIASNILSECTDLGSSFSASTEQYLQENGWRVTPLDAEPSAGAGKQLKLRIINALSGGNAFLGHRKSVSIIAELYNDGQLVDSYRETRNSSGGFSGAFKGSCAVLYRCTNTLGNDVAKWMADK
jgi:hypothetical protein